jgi:hypothetical protein
MEIGDQSRKRRPPALMLSWSLFGFSRTLDDRRSLMDRAKSLVSLHFWLHLRPKCPEDGRRAQPQMEPGFRASDIIKSAGEPIPDLASSSSRDEIATQNPTKSGARPFGGGVARSFTIRRIWDEMGSSWKTTSRCPGRSADKL